MSSEKDKYDLVFITDISVNEEVAEIIECYKDEKVYPKITLLDHHPTALELNKYEWANVIIKDKLIWSSVDFNADQEYKVSGTYLFYKWLNENNYNMESIKCLGDQRNLSFFVETVRRYDTWEWKTIFNIEEPKLWNDLFYILGRDIFMDKIFQKIQARMEFDETDNLLLKLE